MRRFSVPENAEDRTYIVVGQVSGALSSAGSLLNW